MYGNPSGDYGKNSTSIFHSVGDGVKIDFWNELWIGDDTLRSTFPQLYIISLQKDAAVSQVWSQTPFQISLWGQTNQFGVYIEEVFLP